MNKWITVLVFGTRTFFPVTLPAKIDEINLRMQERRKLVQQRRSFWRKSNKWFNGKSFARPWSKSTDGLFEALEYAETFHYCIECTNVFTESRGLRPGPCPHCGSRAAWDAWVKE